ncbi:hypothetical protein LX87_02561 [Larkinella arboricola]|uniref:Transglutaminase superfamily protein n=1 Tax=Larkinella arboricola TaxID=643671 RepID=A0A327X3Z4_LARAB|nr:hypothetical protein [Larkinella arboricola]RAJ97658.1 hypothetical protein LX87_02561 [Larkinella arboricola]
MTLFRNALIFGVFNLFCSTGFSQLAPVETVSEALTHISSSSVKSSLNNRQRVSVAVGMEQQLFPSYLLARATMPEKSKNYKLGNGDGNVSVMFHNPGLNTSVRVEVAPTPFSDAAVFEGVLQEADRDYEISPRIPWNFEKLRGLLQPTPVNFTVTTYIDNEKVSHRTVVATMRSVNDCPYYWEDDETGSGDLDLNYMYVAYINEDDPVVDEVLSQALQSDIVDAFDGYQTGDKKRVDDQVFSIWYALQKRGIRYSSISTNSSTGVSPNLYSQRIRRIDQTWNNRQANCVDGMVLMASVLRSIHIDPVLVLMADHCVLGYYRDAEHKDLVCLETSMIGDVDLRKVMSVRRRKASRKLFSEARQRAQRHYRNSKEFFEKDPRYRVIVVADVRKSGIRPIGR